MPKFDSRFFGLAGVSEAGCFVFGCNATAKRVGVVFLT